MEHAQEAEQALPLREARHVCIHGQAVHQESSSHGGPLQQEQPLRSAASTYSQRERAMLRLYIMYGRASGRWELVAGHNNSTCLMCGEHVLPT